MPTPQRNQWLSDAFGITLAADSVAADPGTSGEVAAGGQPAPLQGLAPGGAGAAQNRDAAEDLDAPPPPEHGDGAAAIVGVKQQIANLKLWGVEGADAFQAALTQIEADTKAGNAEKAQQALQALLAQVKTAYDQAKTPPVPSAQEIVERKKVAKAVSGKAGSGDEKDVELVTEELAKMPKNMLDMIEKSGTKVKVCRGSVTDYLTDLKGVQPRGWPDGMTWDSVPGLQRPSSKEVVFATVGHDSRNAHVPKTGEGHGSVNLVLHETAHGVDYSQNPLISSSADFVAARTPDVAALSAYETQPGSPGREETFAESCARYYSGDPSSADKTPHLHAYWRQNKLKPPDPPAGAKPSK